MEKILIIFAFIVIRWLLSANKENKKKKTTEPKPVSKPKKNLDDIFGDFMKEVNKGNEPKKVIKPLVNSDTHKAEADTNKKLDWQEVTRSKFDTKKSVDYKNISHSDIPDEPIVATEVSANEEIINDLSSVDLKKAVLYKEILDRKYFSI